MTDELEKVSTPRGEARSMRALSPFDVGVQALNGNPTSAGGGADWFGPSQPIQPVAPPEVAGRTWDFVPGYNLATQPRAYEQVPFATLRSLAESYDPVRLIIERRKDQMCRLPWTLRYRHDDPTKKRPAMHELPEAKRKRVGQLINFFKKPDRQMSFRSWLRGLLEDLLVIDAPSIYCERNNGGGLIGLRYVDGTTIKRVIDSWGRTPEPILWNGAPFMWNGRTITLDNYVAEGFKAVPGSLVADQLPMDVDVPDFVLLPPAYQQILKGLPAVDYTVADLVYRPQNLRPGKIYGFSPVEQIIQTVSTAFRRSVSQMEYFREGNMPEGVFGLPETWTVDQVTQYQNWWDSLFVGNMGRRRQIKFMAGDGKFQAFKEPPLKTEFDEWLIRIVCFAFSYPPAAFVSLSNRSTAEQHEKQAEEEGLEPLKLWAAETFNEILNREFPDDDVEFAWTEEQEIDPVKQAEILRGYAADGVYTINTVRGKLGEEADPNPAANMLMVKTATGYVPIDNGQLENKVAEAKALAAAVPKPAPGGTGTTVNVNSRRPKKTGDGKAKPKKKTE